MFIEPHLIKVTSTAAKTIIGEEMAIENAKTGKVTAVVAVIYLNGKSKVNLQNANLQKKQDPNRHVQAIRAQQETDSPRKTIRVLLDTGLSGDLLFMKKGSTKCIPVVRRAVSESWGTSNGTFQTKKVGNGEVSFVDYSGRKKIYLKPAIVEYAHNGMLPFYDLILGEQTLHDLGVVLDFKEKTITIDEILLPMRNINNLHQQPSISMARGSIDNSFRKNISKIKI
jgi:hypothetical protein